MFVTLCLNPTIQKTLLFDKIQKGEVNRASKSFTDVSGKGINVSRVLSQLGKQVLHITQLAEDDRNFFERELDRLQIRLLAGWTKVRARTCTTLIEEQTLENATISRCITELVESGSRVEPETESLLFNCFKHLLDNNHQEIEFLIISGSKAPGFSDSLFAELALKAHSLNIMTILDIRGSDLKELLKSLSKRPVKADEVPLIIKPNVQELKETFFEEVNEPLCEKQINDFIIRLYKEYGLKSVITRGKDSTLAFDGKQLLEKKSEFIPADKVLNTIGCGDAFAAGLAAALSEGKSFEEALNKGLECGALNAMTIQPGSIK